ncbi:hypothetical protein G3O08_00890 [Cryomorpha ignava]|uniref:Uncharacterized protein n=1 Tax=Cryomorpha ignava TaxID=101383 RepID=A0A7K3WKK0_9FLAO|nr:hypothetical protein [Cryomorpha ignava]NEN22058.1 hypothetical protein [Cryomorpha ignava]
MNCALVMYNGLIGERVHRNQFLNPATISAISTAMVAAAFLKLSDVRYLGYAII